MAASIGDRELIVGVSRDLVMALAPEEGAIFRPVSVAYFEDPARLRQAPKDDMLGFGAGDAVMFLTPVALSVLTDVVVYLRSELAKAAAKDAANTLDNMVRSLFRRFHRDDHGSAPVPALTREQLVEVRRRAFEKATALGIHEARAQLLADATVGSLVVSI